MMASSRVTARLVPLLLVASVLAGCLGGGDDTPTAAADDTPEDAVIEPVEVPEKIAPKRSAIVGTVISDAFLPIADAEIVIKDLNVNATTDASGRYKFEDIQPGRYKMFAQADGFLVNQTEQKVQIEAGKAAVVNFILTELAGVEPYTVVTEQRGFIECAVGTAANLGGECVPWASVPLGLSPANSQPILVWDYDPRTATALVAELIWSPPSGGALAQELRLRLQSAPGIGTPLTYATQQGASPVVINFDVSEFEVPDNVENFELSTNVDPPNGGNVVYQQAYTIFWSEFYYHLPGPDYSAIPDGFNP